MTVSRRRPRLLLVLLGAVACLARPAPGRAEARGLWVECEGSNATLDTRERIDELVERARAGNFNLLYVQIYRHDRAWFNSAIADATPYRTVFSREKMDPLSYLIQKAHAAGIQVHAWMNMFRIGKDLSAPVVRRLGREVVTRDGTGKSLADYKPELLPDGGYWLDPGDKRVCRYLLEVIAELIRKYPGVDGIHLDFVRYPYASATGGSLWAGRRDFGYGAESVTRFREWTGLDPLKMELTRENCQAWDNWRRFQVNAFVESATELARSLKPSLTVSAAAVAWADRAYLSSFQDWRRWLEEGLLDVVAVMNYSTDERVTRYLTNAALAAQGKRRVYVGLGAYLLLKKQPVLFREIEDARAAAAPGIVFFSYDALCEDPGIFALLGKQYFPAPAPVPPFPWKR